MTKNNNDGESPEEIVASIDDLLTQILRRLPVKSLYNFKKVSKRWHSLITNPEFIQRWRNPNRNRAIGTFLPTFKNYDFFMYVPFFPKDSTLMRKFRHSSDIGIIHACNGLLLCKIELYYYVYNPTTGYKSVVTLPKLDPNIDIKGMYLAFDPANSLYPYKVVCIHRTPHIPGGHFLIEIYSPETPGEWRSSGFQPFPAMVNFRHGVYWNNSIHWISLGSGDALYFNVRNHVIEKMPNPPPSCYDRNSYFGESCDHLHIIGVRDVETEFNVYEMKRDYSEWFVKYHVDLSPLLAAYPPIIPECFSDAYWTMYSYRVLSMVRGEEGDENTSFLVMLLQGKFIIRYNIISKTFEKLHESGVEPVATSMLPWRHINGFEHIESLCSV